MATIPSGSKFFSQSKDINTIYGGPESLKKQSEWYTTQDIINTIGGGIKLNFKWSKDQSYESERIKGKVFLLGISIDNLVLENDKTYNLLIKRYRSAEKLNRGDEEKPTKFRTAGFKHEADLQASGNRRPNKIQITSTSLKYYNFNQDYFFKQIFEESSPDVTIRSTGSGGKKFSGKRGWLRLSFDLEIINSDGSNEVISDVGKITMISSYLAADQESSEVRTISYNINS